MTKQHIFWLVFFLIYAYAMIHYLGPDISNKVERKNHGMSIQQQVPRERTNFRKAELPLYENLQTDFIRQSTILRMLFHWILFVVCEGACLYRIACYFRSDYKWEYLKRCDISRFLQRQNTTVMCLYDYIRDRLNNNLSTHELMKYEWARLESFKTYPKSAPHFPLTLARDGFYYTGEGTFVTCFCCACKLDTTQHDDIAEGHRHHSPNCRFARGESSANVPIYHDTTSSQVGPNGNTRYVTETSRRQSYRGWPLTSPAITMQLAEAGFFYAGTKDVVSCYSCGIRLKDWTPHDDPWKVHALFSPQCQHVRRCKRDSFIRQICSAVTNEVVRQETHSTDIMSRDMQSRAAQILRQMGHSDIRIKDAILQFRLMRDNEELSAKALIEYIHDPEPNLSGPNAYSPSFLAFVSAVNSTLRDASHMERAPLRTANERETLQNAETGQLQDEIEKLKHEKECKFCLDKEVCIVFLPCGHLVACADCAQQFRTCPVCRAFIKGTVRIYWS